MPSWFGPRQRRWLVRAGLACAILVTALAWHRADLDQRPGTVLLTDRHGRFLAELGRPPDRDDAGEATDAQVVGFWPIAARGTRIAASTLALEDRRFYRHPGVDPLAIGRAAWQNLQHRRRVSGASTIAMQVARLQHPARRTFANKAVEALTATFLVLRHGRDAVLDRYLQLAPYGNRIHGVGYAARLYFDKPVADLSWAETGFLAALPQAPGRMNPYTRSGRADAVVRGRRVLDLLVQSGQLTAEEHRLAHAQIEHLRPVPRHRRPLDAMHAILRLQATLSDPAVAARLAAARLDDRPLAATLDLDLQEWIGQRLFDAVEGWRPDGAGNAAAVVLRLADREVLASVGSSGYFDAASAGAIDFTTIPRAAGSTLKPFLYALALDRGHITPASVLDDTARGPGGIENSDDRFLGPVLPRIALANSRNVPAARLLEQLSLDEGYGFLAELGLHQRELPAGRYGLGLAIGNLPVTLEHLVTAYAALADGGRWQSPRWLTKLQSDPSHPILSADSAALITDFLADPMARLPTFPRSGPTELPFAAAIKTGTSSGFRDSWAVGYDREYVVGVWVGHPQALPMHGLSGYRAAAGLVRSILLRLHPGQIDGLGGAGFSPPPGRSMVRLCGSSGALASAACERVVSEWLRPGEEPIEACSIHFRQAASPTLPLAAQRASPGHGAGQRVQLRVTAPEDGAAVLGDPETPPELSTLALRVEVAPAVDQVVWYVDGEPFAVVGEPYATRWQLTPGAHTFEVRLPHAPSRSGRVTVTVQ